MLLLRLRRAVLLLVRRGLLVPLARALQGLVRREPARPVPGQELDCLGLKPQELVPQVQARACLVVQVLRAQGPVQQARPGLALVLDC